MLLLKKICKNIAIVFLLYSFQIQSVFACKYNIRETGFVDLGSEYYFINLYIDQNSSKEFVDSFQQIATELLEDSNIKPQVVNIDFERNRVAIKYLNECPNKSLPIAIIVSPDDQSIILPVDFREQFFKVSLEKVVKDILFSPVREHILKEVINTYGVVLLIEGENEQKNYQAKEAVKRAIQNIQNKMVFLPKPIKHPPELVSVPNRLIKNEKILLWSLGLDSEQIEEPVVAVIYGRARWIGPLFKGDKITSENLSAILFTIGLDCECGLDKSWMQGTMLPVKWDKTLQNRVAKNLGFDPENPMIKMEINRILRMGSSYPGVPIRMLSERFKSDSIDKSNNDSTLKKMITSHYSSQQPDLKDVSEKQSSKFVLRETFYLIFGLFVLILIGGMFVYFKAAGRKK